MATVAENIISFYKSLQPPAKLPKGYSFLYPQQHAETIKLVEEFFHKFYNDNKQRTIILGINPGRFGAGMTGINFTAPRQLEIFCGIQHHFKNSSELSAEFIYEMIAAYGGVQKFYNKFLFSSICLLGLIKNGVNINYYDDKALLNAVTPFIVHSLQQQLQLPVSRKRVFIIGGDKNLKFFEKLNNEHAFFEEVISLPHPRYIMQYRRKHIKDYINEYLSKLRQT
ncbi:MAG: DUF4918 domain-containing protein [Chitinophagaceae bacterium]